MVRRSRLEIYFDLLKVVERGVDKPTRIMYRSNLSWPRLQKYLDSLVRHDLLVENEINEKRRYRITEKGFKVLKYFDTVEKALPLLSASR